MKKGTRFAVTAITDLEDGQRMGIQCEMEGSIMGISGILCGCMEQNPQIAMALLLACGGYLKDTHPDIAKQLRKIADDKVPNVSGLIDELENQIKNKKDQQDESDDKSGGTFL